MVWTKVIAKTGKLFTDDEVRNTLGVLEQHFANQSVLVLILDHTQSLQLPFLFRSLVDVLHDTKQ